METKEKNKKGFWASLFAPKQPCSCSCGSNLIVEEPERPAASCCEAAPAPTSGIREIKVLGPGCAKCKATYQALEKAIADNHLDVRLTKVEDITDIMSYNVMGTPAVMVDGVVKVKGHVPSDNEIKQLLGL